MQHRTGCAEPGHAMVELSSLQSSVIYEDGVWSQTQSAKGLQESSTLNHSKNLKSVKQNWAILPRHG